MQLCINKSRLFRPFFVQYCKKILSQILRHEFGHNLGMPHVHAVHNGGNVHPNDWDCGHKGDIMGGNSRGQWSPCSVMDFRRMYTLYFSQDLWCLPCKMHKKYFFKKYFL